MQDSGPQRAGLRTTVLENQTVPAQCHGYNVCVR